MALVSTKKKKRGISPLLPVCAVVLLALVVVFLFGRKDAPSVPAPRAADEVPAVAEEPNGAIEIRPAAKTAEAPHESAKPAAPKVERELTEREKWYIAETNRLAKTEAILKAREPKTHFQTKEENILELVSKPGAEFFTPPVIDLGPDEVVEMLKRPVEIYDDDDDEAVKAKERTAVFKEEALAFIEQGGTINQFIRHKLNQEAESKALREEVRREMRRILLNEGEEMAEAYLEGANIELKNIGLEPVAIGRIDRALLKRKQEGK